MKKILTIIFDGFGLKDNENGNAVKAAKMRNFENLYNSFPHSKLYASEEKVGLLPGQVGNSEVGHMTIGSGRLNKSNECIINDFFKEVDETNESFARLLEDKEKRIHIMGLCSDGNIHAGVDDFISMFDLLYKNGFKNVYFHLITDGRDTQIDVAYKYISMIENKIKEYNVGSIASLCGRYYAMDRDNNYEKTKLYYDLVTKGIGTSVLNIENALKSMYAKGVYDEFIKPILVNPNGLIKDNDAIIWMNYRADRSKQILNAFTNPKFADFATKNYEKLDVYSFFEIDKNIKTNCFIGNKSIENPLGIYLSRLGLKQARIAESEKFAHVTYFFDGGYEGKIPGCDKFHVPSPEVATYDLKPEMNAVSVTKKVIDCMENDYDFILVNYANPDMVGHTGNMTATTTACMALDICLAKLIEKAEDNFYTIILMADHGNADTMINEDGSICTTHSLAMVPFVINDPKIKLKPEGDLTMVAPTILEYMDIAIPEEMKESGSLIETS